jgi:hypothetical protein
VFCCYFNVLVFSGALIVLVFGSLNVIGSGSLQSCKGKYSASGSKLEEYQQGILKVPHSGLVCLLSYGVSDLVCLEVKECQDFSK